MKAKIRRPVIAFSVLSAVYWVLVANFIGVSSPLGGFGKHPYWIVALASVLPPAIYSVATLYFCHWLVRRAVRQIPQSEGD